MKIYAVYKGEKFLCEGTAKQCAEELGVKKKTIWWWNSASCHMRIEQRIKKNKKANRRYAIVIEGE